MELRYYQREAVGAVWNHLRTKENNPCIVLPTGTGKSLCIAQLAKDAVEKWNGRVLVLAHVKELLEQNAAKIRRLCPELKVGVYSAGLGSRDTDDQVVVAGIQSVYNKAEELGSVDLAVIDEVHTIPPGHGEDGEGRYHQFFRDMKNINPHVRLVGLTATPFRLKGGEICRPGNLLNEICYEAGLKEMIEKGYLSPMTSRAGRTEADLEHLHIRAGEFVAEDVEKAMNKAEITDAACREIAELTKDRRTVLIFCTSVAHCESVAKKIEQYTGCGCAVVTGNTPAPERAEIIARMRGESVRTDLFDKPKPPLKYCANVSVMTTGLDVPNIDCVVMLRPTASPGLLLQCAGRGFRLSPETGKTNCLFLDFGGNILRHGPLDMIRAVDKSSGKGDAPAKKCPECFALIHAAYRKCPECGYEFPAGERTELTAKAARAGVISGETFIDEYDVRKVFYCVHAKRFAPPDTPKTMRIDYDVGSGDYKSEWVCPEHTGYAREKFVKWWLKRAAPGFPVPDTAEEAVRLAGSGILAEPVAITVKWVAGEQFERITKCRLGPIPEPREPGDDAELFEQRNWPSNSPADLGVAQDNGIPF